MKTGLQALILAVLVVAGQASAQNSQSSSETGAPSGIGGMIKSRTDVIMGATTSGNLAELKIKVGDQVTKGDPIALVDCSGQKAGLSKAYAEHAKAKSAARVKRAQHAEGILSKRELDTAEADLKIAGAGIGVQRSQVSQCDIKAAASGTIISVLVSQGQWLNQGDAIVHIVDTDDLYLALNAPEASWGRMAPGAKITATTLVSNTTVNAEVSNRSEYINEHSGFALEAAIVESQAASVERVVPGMRVVVE